VGGGLQGPRTRYVKEGEALLARCQGTDSGGREEELPLESKHSAAEGRYGVTLSSTGEAGRAGQVTGECGMPSGPGDELLPGFLIETARGVTFLRISFAATWR